MKRSPCINYIILHTWRLTNVSNNFKTFRHKYRTLKILRFSQIIFMYYIIIICIFEMRFRYLTNNIFHILRWRTIQLECIKFKNIGIFFLCFLNKLQMTTQYIYVEILWPWLYIIECDYLVIELHCFSSIAFWL